MYEEIEIDGEIIKLKTHISEEETGIVTSSCISSVSECTCAICRITSEIKLSANDEVVVHSGTNRLPGTVCIPGCK